ncbi:alpha/beta fold hydrolase [Saccharomonospora halophila]|uniref:alpha/beta fold hydrolase n=1 Tax=Saccharomonospora halophila TaxID=129922 RepID=UPI000372CFC7|nr:alpha/beta hydrolase [Saccharomonospora halophila]
MSTIDINECSLYYELSGAGPPVLFISGATGDAGHWTEVAEVLADEHTVLAYDRRGNSRSPRPEDGTVAPLFDEQADDAAELLRALDLAPALAYGNSSGAIILTNLVLRHADVLRGAIFHEPPYVAVTSTAQAVGTALRSLVEEGMARGGPPAAMELFIRWVFGDDVFESFDPDFRARVLGNGAEFFGTEMEATPAYLPSSDELAEVRLPCVVACGADNRDPAATHHWMYEASQWLADRLSVTPVETPGAHVPQLSPPHELAEMLRPVLSRLQVREPSGPG